MVNVHDIDDTGTKPTDAPHINVTHTETTDGLPPIEHFHPDDTQKRDLASQTQAKIAQLSNDETNKRQEPTQMLIDAFQGEDPEAFLAAVTSFKLDLASENKRATPTQQAEKLAAVKLDNGKTLLQHVLDYEYSTASENKKTIFKHLVASLEKFWVTINTEDDPLLKATTKNNEPLLKILLPAYNIYKRIGRQADRDTVPRIKAAINAANTSTTLVCIAENHNASALSSPALDSINKDLNKLIEERKRIISGQPDDSVTLNNNVNATEQTVDAKNIVDSSLTNPLKKAVSEGLNNSVNTAEQTVDPKNIVTSSLTNSLKEAASKGLNNNVNATEQTDDSNLKKLLIEAVSKAFENDNAEPFKTAIEALEKSFEKTEDFQNCLFHIQSTKSVLVNEKAPKKKYYEKKQLSLLQHATYAPVITERTENTKQICALLFEKLGKKLVPITNTDNDPLRRACLNRQPELIRLLIPPYENLKNSSSDLVILTKDQKTQINRSLEKAKGLLSQNDEKNQEIIKKTEKPVKKQNMLMTTAKQHPFKAAAFVASALMFIFIGTMSACLASEDKGIHRFAHECMQTLASLFCGGNGHAFGLEQAPNYSHGHKTGVLMFSASVVTLGLGLVGLVADKYRAGKNHSSP